MLSTSCKTNEMARYDITSCKVKWISRIEVLHVTETNWLKVKKLQVKLKLLNMNVGQTNEIARNEDTDIYRQMKWSTSNSCRFFFSYMKYYHIEPCYMSYMKWFSFGAFNFTLHEIFSYRAITIVLHQVVPIRAISFNLAWGIFISRNLICLTSGTTHSFPFHLSVHEVFLFRAI